MPPNPLDATGLDLPVTPPLCQGARPARTSRIHLPVPLPYPRVLFSAALALIPGGLKAGSAPQHSAVALRQRSLLPPRWRPGTTRTLTPACVTSPTGLPASLTHPSSTFRLQPRRQPGHRFLSQISVTDPFQTSLYPSELVAVPRRIEFVILRTACSLPVAPHPASLRRSYLQLRGLGLPRHGLPPCCVCALAGALGWVLTHRLRGRRCSRRHLLW